VGLAPRAGPEVPVRAAGRGRAPPARARWRGREEVRNRAPARTDGHGHHEAPGRCRGAGRLEDRGTGPPRGLRAGRDDGAGRRPEASLARRTRIAASSALERKAELDPARVRTASAIWSAGWTYLEMIRSPPAWRKSMARVPGGMFEMATAAPMSSDTMTPSN